MWPPGLANFLGLEITLLFLWIIGMPFLLSRDMKLTSDEKLKMQDLKTALGQAWQNSRGLVAVLTGIWLLAVLVYCVLPLAVAKTMFGKLILFPLCLTGVGVIWFAVVSKKHGIPLMWSCFVPIGSKIQLYALQHGEEVEGPSGWAFDHFSKRPRQVGTAVLLAWLSVLVFVSGVVLMRVKESFITWLISSPAAELIADRSSSSPNKEEPKDQGPAPAAPSTRPETYVRPEGPSVPFAPSTHPEAYAGPGVPSPAPVAPSAHPQPYVEPVVPPPIQDLFAKNSLEYLSDLSEFDVKAGPWPFAKKGTLEGQNLIRVGGSPSPKGLSMHPPDKGFSAAKYRLGRKATVFRAVAALDDSVSIMWNPAVFEVLGDGRSLWQSAPLSQERKSQECRVDITNVDVLELRVYAKGSHFGLRAVWVEPRIFRLADSPAEGNK